MFLFYAVIHLSVCFVGAASYEICSREVDWSELGDQRDLSYYCNYLHLPVSGSEGNMF